LVSPESPISIQFTQMWVSRMITLARPNRLPVLLARGYRREFFPFQR
jgi:hypothetical protein